MEICWCVDSLVRRATRVEQNGVALSLDVELKPTPKLIWRFLPFNAPALKRSYAPGTAERSDPLSFPPLLPLTLGMAGTEEVNAVGTILANPKESLTTRFRALFTLRNLGGAEAVEWISRTFVDDSALLKHELAYCLGQMQDERAIPILETVLKDTNQEPMVRHEAGEALGAIGNPKVLDLLKEYSEDPVVEVAETCQLAVRRLEKGVAELRAQLLDEALPLFERYRAMFALRNLGTEEAVLALGDGLLCGSALFRHEIGYVLGQVQHEASVPQLQAALERAGRAPWCGTSAPRRWAPSGRSPACRSCAASAPDRERASSRRAASGGAQRLRDRAESAPRPANMLHPVMIAIVTANTSITILYWAFILTEVFSKKISTEAKAKDNPV
ncbi:hypothetical protein ANANG_G00093550 [Anguilla anguilla]|uniref:deoxyhypusine monooxygenase n=1 Tax=Anguilla anguilla TaxID=7936 RepID=A0A9D3MP87_ANGAN|nr:hypothetical protein ANANG_G00093550 [Anguilla anguilla]